MASACTAFGKAAPAVWHVQYPLTQPEPLFTSNVCCEADPACRVYPIGHVLPVGEMGGTDPGAPPLTPLLPLPLPDGVEGVEGVEGAPGAGVTRALTLHSPP